MVNPSCIIWAFPTFRHALFTGFHTPITRSDIKVDHRDCSDHRGLPGVYQHSVTFLINLSRIDERHYSHRSARLGLNHRGNRRGWGH